MDSSAVQTAVTLLIVSGAVAYLVRVAWQALFARQQRGACRAGCGGCPAVAHSTPGRRAFVSLEDLRASAHVAQQRAAPSNLDGSRRNGHSSEN